MSALNRILLIDDDEDFILLLRMAFEYAGFRGGIQFARTGSEATELLEQSANSGARALPQLALLDLRLPGVHGFDVLRWIRCRPELNAVTVMVLTGVEADGEAALARQIGAEDYFVKPMEFNGLVSLAEHICCRYLELGPVSQNTGFSSVPIRVIRGQD